MPSCLVAVLLLATSAAFGAQTTVGVDATAPWQGFMNVFNLPDEGGAFLFGSGWGTVDLRATFSDSTLSLFPNSIGDTAGYWYKGGGGPGSVGNKTMEANMYVETTGSLSGQVVTFTAEVLSNTLCDSVYVNCLH